MSEEQQGGFFSQIKNQIIAGIGIIITTAGGLVVSNMEALFSPPAPVEEVTVVQDSLQNKPQEIIINIPEQKQPVKETIIIKEVPAKTESKKEKEYESW
jgi:hypothetical protein